MEKNKIYDLILTFIYSPPVSLVPRAPRGIVGGGDMLWSSMVQQRGGRAVHWGAARRLSRWGLRAEQQIFYCCFNSQVTLLVFSSGSSAAVLKHTTEIHGTSVYHTDIYMLCTQIPVITILLKMLGCLLSFEYIISSSRHTYVTHLC